MLLQEQWNYWVHCEVFDYWVFIYGYKGFQQWDIWFVI